MRPGFNCYLYLMRLMFKLKVPFEERMSYEEFTVFSMRVHLSESNLYKDERFINGIVELSKNLNK